jgi:hypothetical protein
MKANASYSTRVSLNLHRERLINTISILPINRLNLLTIFVDDNGYQSLSSAGLLQSVSFGHSLQPALADCFIRSAKLDVAIEGAFSPFRESPSSIH